MEFDHAVELLKKAVKESHIANQKHIDLTLIDSRRRDECMTALIVVRQAVDDGQLTEDELKNRLGLG